jgi:hypothetical protein
MNLTVSELLTVVGRLDDSPGVDTPRDRFRRFLTERMTDVQAAHAVIQECRQSIGEQHQRALQDAIVLIGKLLGFATTFGPYQHHPAAAPIAGQWEWRRRLHVTVAPCTGHMGMPELDALAKFVRGERPPRPGDVPRVGLCVLTPTCATRIRIEETFRARTHADLRLTSVDGLLHMADMVASGVLTHDAMSQVLNPDTHIDSLLKLLDRPAPVVLSNPEPVNPDPAPEHAVPPDGRCWLAVVRLPADTPPDQFVGSVIARRRLLGVTPASDVERPIDTGDWVGVCIAGEGCVADARVEDLVTNGSGTVRDSERFAQVLRLTDVHVYPKPISPGHHVIHALEATLNGHSGAIATPIPREEFDMVTRGAHAAGTS